MDTLLFSKLCATASALQLSTYRPTAYLRVKNGKFNAQPMVTVKLRALIFLEVGALLAILFPGEIRHLIQTTRWRLKFNIHITHIPQCLEVVHL